VHAQRHGAYLADTGLLETTLGVPMVFVFRCDSSPSFTAVFLTGAGKP